MRRFGRLTRNALTLLSLLLSVATVKLWLYSYGAHDEVYCQRVTHDAAGQYAEWVSLGYDRGGAYARFEGIGTPTEAIQIHPNYWQADGWSCHFWSSGRSSGVYPYVRSERGRPELVRLAGFQLTTGFHPEPKDPYRRHTAGVVFPLWVVALLTAVAPARRLVRWRRRRPSMPADARPCTTCGYDLRATPHRCPECGAVPASEPA